MGLDCYLDAAAHALHDQQQTFAAALDCRVPTIRCHSRTHTQSSTAPPSVRFLLRVRAGQPREATPHKLPVLFPVIDRPLLNETANRACGAGANVREFDLALSLVRGRLVVVRHHTRSPLKCH